MCFTFRLEPLHVLLNACGGEFWLSSLMMDLQCILHSLLVCPKKKKNNSVVVDGGAVVEFFCLSISYGYCLGLGVNAFVFWWAMTEINSIIEMILNIV